MTNNGKKKKMDEKQSLASTGKQYGNADFTEDANTFTKDKKRTKAELVFELRFASEEMAKHPHGSPEWERAYKLYKELRTYVIGDFTEDAFSSGSYPTTTRLMAAMDRLYFILVRQEKTYMNEIARMSDADSSKVYRHKLLTEFNADLLP